MQKPVAEKTDVPGIEAADFALPPGATAVKFDVDAKRIDFEVPESTPTKLGELFVKQSCELADASRGRKVVVRANYFRKTGQSGVNPQLPTQLTQGQFESSARLDIGVSAP
jgi:hypothetical protein